MSYSCETCGKTFVAKRSMMYHSSRKTCRPTVVEEPVVEPVEPVEPVEVKEAPSALTPLGLSALTPPLKWVGGKTQLLPAVLARFPSVLHNYYEPFLGGGSVLLAVLGEPRIRITGKVYASDVNPHLIGFYQNVQTNLPELWEALQTVLEEQKTSGMSDEEYYYAQRTRFNGLSKEDVGSPLGSALFLYLNKTGFRGVYREGPRGYNVPFGHYKNPTVATYAHLEAVSRVIQGVVFRVCSFQEVLLGDIGFDDMVYLDPPYAPEKKGSFTGYVAAGFPVEQHEALFSACRLLKADGRKVLMSNADVPWVRDALPASEGWVYQAMSCRRAIHSKRPDSRAMEVLVSSF